MSKKSPESQTSDQARGDEASEDREPGVTIFFAFVRFIIATGTGLLVGYPIGAMAIPPPPRSDTVIPASDPGGTILLACITGALAGLAVSSAIRKGARPPET